MYGRIPGSRFVDGNVGEREEMGPHHLEQLELLLWSLAQLPLQLCRGGGGGGVRERR